MAKRKSRSNQTSALLYRNSALIALSLVSLLLISVFGKTIFSNFKLLLNPTGSQAGSAGDMWADVVIGKRDFGEISPREVTDYKLSSPGGVVVDKSTNPGRMYIWDSGNSRILGIDLATCYNQNAPCKASIVIGQPQATDYGACNQDASFRTYPKRKPASSSTLCGISEGTKTTLEDKSFVGMYVDSQGNLYVPDSRNHRVLKFNSPFTTDTVADDVWGQADFSSNGCNRTGGIGNFDGEAAPLPANNTLCFHAADSAGASVTLDSSGNMWVADGGNNRILRFPKQADGTIAKAADVVIGQSNFTQGGDFSTGSALNRLSNPGMVKFDAVGNMYVADKGNNRVLVFQEPFSSGMSATRVITSDFNELTSLEIDPQARGIWTYDSAGYDARLQLWDFQGNKLKELPHLGNKGGGGIGFDAQGNILVSNYLYGQDVFRYTPNADGTYSITKSLFSPPGGYNLTTSERLEHNAWVGVAIAANQLVVSDGRLLFWNNLSNLTSGQAPSGFLGSTSFTTLPNPAYTQVKADAHSRVWALLPTKVEIYQAPLTTQQAPIKVITSPLKTIDGQQFDFKDLNGLVPTDEGDYLWVTEVSKSRVFRIKNPLSTAPVVDVVLGQKDLASGLCNRGLVSAPNTGSTQTATRDMLCRPGALAIDKKGNLYVSDHSLEAEGNWRLLLFSPTLFSSNLTSVQYAPLATKEFPRAYGSQTQSHATFEPAFDSSNRMVVGYNPYLGPRFIEYYNDPTQVNTNNPSDPTFALPNGKFNDFYGWPVAMTFDSQNNLYAFDANRGQVRIYWQPFGVTASTQPSPSLSVTPTPVTTSPTPSPKPTPVPSPTPLPSSTPVPTDTVPPVVSLTYPVNGQVLARRQALTLTASASDNVQVSKVDFLVNQVLVCQDFVGPYTCNWQAPAGKNKTMTIEARATDTAGNTKSSSVTVSVN